MHYMTKMRTAIKREKKIRKAAARLADHVATREVSRHEQRQGAMGGTARMIYRVNYNRVMDSLDMGRFSL